MENHQNPQLVLSVGDAFWIKLSESNICVGWNSIQKQAHLTLAFNKNSSYVNLHATRNGDATSSSHKFEIFRIKKSRLKEIENGFTIKIFTLLFSELSMQDIYHFAEYMIPIDIKEMKNWDHFEKIMIKEHLPYIRKKGANRYKVNAELLEKFEEVNIKITQSGEINAGDIIVDRRYFWALNNKSGFYCDENGKMRVIINIDKKYYILMAPKSLFFLRAIINSIMRRDLYYTISTRTRLAIKKLQQDSDLNELNEIFKKLIIG